MGESPLHRFLKLAGYVWLARQNCSLIKFEMAPPVIRDKHIQQHNEWMKGRKKRYAQTDFDFTPIPHELHRLDKKIVLDILALGQLRDGTELVDTGIKYKDGKDPERILWQREDHLKFCLRGVEIKVSRSDFLSGFCASGCHYHYLLTPMGLVRKHEIPDHVGLLEFNKHKFNATWLDYGKKWELAGLRLVKRPRLMDVPERNVLTCVVDLARKSSWRIHELIAEEIEESGMNQPLSSIELQIPKLKETQHENPPT